MGRPLAGADVVVAGAGGAAHAVVFACLAAGARAGDGRQPDGRPRPTRSSSAFAGVGAGARGRRSRSTTPAFAAALATADLAVNATTVGMLDPGATIAVDALPATATVFDLVYVPAETPLARGRPGARPAGGERLGDAHRPGGDRVRALDRRRRHGRRHARGRRAAARRPDGAA